MGKIIDKVILCFLGTGIAFLLLFSFTGSYVAATVCSLLLLGIIGIFYNKAELKAPEHKLSKRDFIRTVLLEGNGYLKALVEAALPGERVSDAGGNTLLERNGKKSLVCYLYKFGSLSEEDVAKCYRSANEFGADTIYALTNHTERKALAVTAYIRQRFVLIGAGATYKFLLKRGLIPDKTEKQRQKAKPGVVLSSALSASNAKYFIFAGASTALVALLTPLTTYYIVFSFINLVLASLCLLFSEIGDGKNDLFA